MEGRKDEGDFMGDLRSRKNSLGNNEIEFCLRETPKEN